ncbi:dihydrofolate reductase [Parasphingopyxis algicola]|uniref:dihydrofolate reductase n=1 Tax=Parasphingopyxis algicola TaxID=2026624 RepID=UPI0015A3CCB8|nr:dihydrofolate reductase [Parasphingopyxis algicola]QLC26595.1 dihydrofolate reductase [Parasphingopyxis algicola]
MTAKPRIIFHLARADNGVIGKDERLPWRIPADLKRLKANTMGKPMIMGRKTFESFKSPLPGRRHIVLTRSKSWSADGAEVVQSPEAAVALAGDVEEIAILGGAEIYRLFLPEADLIELTEVHMEPDGDTRIEAFDPAVWTETARDDYPAEGDRPAFSFVTLERIR